MTTAYDVPAGSLIEALAKKLADNDKIIPPSWTPFVKTGIHRENAPMDPDWWYTRSAAVLRKVYMNGPIGVERLSGCYGGNRDRGSKPNKAVKGSRSVVRKCLMQLEEAGLVAKDRNKGRVVTNEGRALLDNTAHAVGQ